MPERGRSIDLGTELFEADVFTRAGCDVRWLRFVDAESGRPLREAVLEFEGWEKFAHPRPTYRALGWAFAFIPEPPGERSYASIERKEAPPRWQLRSDVEGRFAVPREYFSARERGRHREPGLWRRHAWLVEGPARRRILFFPSLRSGEAQSREEARDIPIAQAPVRVRVLGPGELAMPEIPVGVEWVHEDPRWPPAYLGAEYSDDEGHVHLPVPCGEVERGRLRFSLRVPGVRGGQVLWARSAAGKARTLALPATRPLADGAGHQVPGARDEPDRLVEYYPYWGLGSNLSVTLLDEEGRPLADREVQVEDVHADSRYIGVPFFAKAGLRTDGAGRLRLPFAADSLPLSGVRTLIWVAGPDGLPEQAGDLWLRAPQQGGAPDGELIGDAGELRLDRLDEDAPLAGWHLWWRGRLLSDRGHPVFRLLRPQTGRGASPSSDPVASRKCGAGSHIRPACDSWPTTTSRSTAVTNSSSIRQPGRETCCVAGSRDRERVAAAAVARRLQQSVPTRGRGRGWVLAPVVTRALVGHGRGFGRASLSSFWLGRSTRPLAPTGQLRSGRRFSDPHRAHWPETQALPR